MKLTQFFLICTFCAMFFACGKRELSTANYEVIPLPQKIEVKEGEPFILNSSTVITYAQGDEDMKRVANFLSEYIKYTTDLQLKTSDQAATGNAIVLQGNLQHANKEAYTLVVDKDKIVIDGASSAGIFYGVQTLRKSISADSAGKDISLSPVNIEDYPRFQYRGMMLDVARHMFPVEFVKEYIDIIALHNINTLHWHITDDQGWRIEIKKYPLLTELGSQRKETVVGRNTTAIGRNSAQYDGKPYGGFYTQEEAKEIVAYAQERFITVIPEVDLPGHMLGALKAYPNLGCTGGPYEVEGRWGVFDDVLCAGNDEIYTFLDDVFTEIIDIFPSKYIHIGGDECPKVRWEKCPKCQAKIKELGLKADKGHTAEERLQSHVMTYVENFLNSKDRQIIGWDEILEGGLAPNATVMSWRGMEGGTLAAKQGHDVIMTPTSHLYFDYYQTTDIENVPLSIGGYVPIEKVYSFDPIPKSLTESEAKHIIGVQANLWTEYIPTTQQVEYMIMPRIDALSEVQWTMPERKDYNSFMLRLINMIKHYDKKGYNYSKTVFDVQPNIVANTDKGVIEIELSTIDNAPIYYTLDGTEPTEKSLKYEGVIVLTEAVTLKAQAFRKDIKSPLYVKEFKINKATLKPIKLNVDPKGTYAFGGPTLLVDGILGNRGGYKDGTWVGFNEADVIATIDLKEVTEFSSVKVGSYVCSGDWIFGIKGLDVSISEDGKTFTSVSTNTYPEITSHKEGVEEKEATFTSQKARWIQVAIKKTDKLPDWHAGKGYAAYLFVDEIQVN